MRHKMNVLPSVIVWITGTVQEVHDGQGSGTGNHLGHRGDEAQPAGDKLVLDVPPRGGDNLLCRRLRGGEGDQTLEAGSGLLGEARIHHEWMNSCHVDIAIWIIGSNLEEKCIHESFHSKF